MSLCTESDISVIVCPHVGNHCHLMFTQFPSATRSPDFVAPFNGYEWWKTSNANSSLQS